MSDVLSRLLAAFIAVLLVVFPEIASVFFRGVLSHRSRQVIVGIEVLPYCSCLLRQRPAETS